MFDRDACINHLPQFESYCCHTVDSSVRVRRRAFYLVAHKKINKYTKDKLLFQRKSPLVVSLFNLIVIKHFYCCWSFYTTSKGNIFLNLTMEPVMRACLLQKAPLSLPMPPPPFFFYHINNKTMSP